MRVIFWLEVEIDGSIAKISLVGLKNFVVHPVVGLAENIVISFGGLTSAVIN